MTGVQTCALPISAKANLIRLLALRVALLCDAYAQVRKGTIHRVTTGEFESITESAIYHYVDGMRLTTPARLWELAQQINAGVFEGRARVMKRSILDTLPEVHADVAYFDSPYPGVMSYEREYKTIDEILEGYSRPTSPFTAKDGATMIDVLLERAQYISIWVLSLGNVVVSIEELEAKMSNFGRQTKAIALRYQHLPAVATAEKKATNQEFVVVGVDEKATLVQYAEVGRQVAQTGPGHVVQMYTNTLSTQASSLSGFSNDAQQQGQAALTDQRIALLEGEIVAEGDPRFDDPHARVIEGAINGDGELGLRSWLVHPPEDPLEPDPQSTSIDEKET